MGFDNIFGIAIRSSRAPRRLFRALLAQRRNMLAGVVALPRLAQRRRGPGGRLLTPDTVNPRRDVRNFRTSLKRPPNAANRFIADMRDLCRRVIRALRPSL